MLRIRGTLGGFFAFFALTGLGCGGVAVLPTGQDASTSPGAEAAACTSRMIVASSFDPSCVSDFDCVGLALIPEGRAAGAAPD